MSSSRSDGADPGTADRPASASAARWRGVAPLALLAAAGALLGALPHLLAWVRTGDPAYIPDMDDLLYLAWSRAVVLRGADRLVDAVRPASGPLMHPWLLFVPPAGLARSLGLGMTGLGIVWRALAGAGIALGLYAALRPALRSPRTAWVAAVLLTFDAGLMYGQPFAREAILLTAPLRGEGADLTAGVPHLMAHLRVVTPALALPFLLLHFGLTLRARAGGGRRSAVAAGVAFGLLFHAYFYFWTTALVGVALAWLLDPKGRRTFATVGLVGLAVGLPAVLANYGVKASTPPDWLARTGKFVPVGHFRELLLPKLQVAAWFLAGLAVFLRRRELTHLWCFIGAGLALTNHQLVTGLQAENAHWLLATGVTTSLLLALLVAPGLEPGSGRPVPRAARAALVALLVAQVGLGVYFRRLEGTRSEETVRWMGAYRAFRRDRPAFPIPPGSVVAGDGEFFFMGAALEELYPLTGRLVDFSSRIEDEELDERLMLNAFLLGFDRAKARALAAGELAISRDWWAAYQSRPGPADDRRRARRGELIDRIWSDPRPLLGRYRVGHIVLPRSAPTGHLTGLARPGPRGATWEHWLVP